MRPIPPKLRAQIDADQYFKVCARQNFYCEGRITIEHAWIYAGKQINELWAFVPLCWYHHLGPGLDKEENQRLSLMWATDEDLAKYPRKDWAQIKRYLFNTP
jgi:hypothetical protein